MTALNHPQILSRMTSNDRIRLVGEVTTLLLASNLHVKYLVSDIKSEFLTPIDYNQFRIYKVGKDPVALVTWAYLTPSIEPKFIHGEYSLRADDWVGGDRLWIIDFMAPFGHATRVIQDLRTNVFPNDSAKAIRVDVNGQLKRVYKLHGKNVSKSFNRD